MSNYNLETSIRNWQSELTFIIIIIIILLN